MYSVCKVCRKVYEKFYEKGMEYTPPVCGRACFFTYLRKSSYHKGFNTKISLHSDSKIKLYNNSDFSLRSKYEIRFGELISNSALKEFEYEPYSFKLSNNMVYVPDYVYLPNAVVIEVKGLWESTAWTKFKLFTHDYGYNTLLITESVLKRLSIKEACSGKISKRNIG